MIIINNNLQDVNMSQSHPQFYMQLTTIRDFVRYAVTEFNKAQLHFGHGTTNAYDEAVYLISFTLNLPLELLDTMLDATLLDTEKESVYAMLQRRIQERIPAPYLTNEAWLGDYCFYVNKNVIIPRSFIAELLREQLIPWITDPDGIYAVLDLCTGSGCLAIIAAEAFPNANVHAIDISPEALEIATRNVHQYLLEEQIQLYQGDLFDPVDNYKYDVIISNPPYVTLESMARLPKEYLHEPALALEAGADGMDIVRRILKAAPNHLNTNGLLIIEVGHNRHFVEAAFFDLPMVWLETSGGSDMIFMVTAADLKNYFKASV